MLLAEQPMHPYQLEKAVKDRDMRFWTEISMSSIYKLLNKLAREELVTKSREEGKNGIAKNTFALTLAGRTALEARIREIITEPEHTRWRMDLATSHLSVLPIEDALECLDAYREKLLESIQGYRDLESYLTSQSCPVHALALARRPQCLLEGEVRWLDEYRSDLKTGGNGYE
jgi:DNA-binding PadR family transcriptional regulator